MVRLPDRSGKPTTSFGDSASSRCAYEDGSPLPLAQFSPPPTFSSRCSSGSTVSSLSNRWLKKPLELLRRRSFHCGSRGIKLRKTCDQGRKATRTERPKMPTTELPTCSKHNQRIRVSVQIAPKTSDGCPNRHSSSRCAFVCCCNFRGRCSGGLGTADGSKAGGRSPRFAGSGCGDCKN